MDNPELHKTKKGFIAIKSGEEPVVITEHEDIEELRALLKERREIGTKITKKLRDLGLNIAECAGTNVGHHADE